MGLALLCEGSGLPLRVLWAPSGPGAARAVPGWRVCAFPSACVLHLSHGAPAAQLLCLGFLVDTVPH